MGWWTMGEPEVFSIRVPGEPVGKGRHRTTTIGGKVRSYTPARTREYESRVASAGLDVIDSPLECPIGVQMMIVHRIPASWPKWKKVMAETGELLPTGKPDASNIVKAVEDGLNGVAWVDDSQIVVLSAWRGYTSQGIEALSQPCVIVEIEAIPRFGSSTNKKPEKRNERPSERGCNA